MTMNNDPVFAVGQRSAAAVCTAAKTTYSDTANAVLLVTAGANGSLISRLSAIARATVTATQLQLYLSTDGGTTLILLTTQLMAAYTMAQTTQAPLVDFGYTDSAPLRLGPNERLYAAIGVALVGGVAFSATAQDL